MLVGPRVSLETATHNLNYVEGIGRGFKTILIIVEDDVWIGANVTIYGGVTIGKGSVIASFSLVNRNVDKTLYLVEFQLRKSKT